jgi:ATP-dependent DNA helicase PIF1
MLTEWFVTNQKYPGARGLCYCDFPSKWGWNKKTRTWEKRQRGSGKIGRMYFVDPSCGERYYLRILLLIVKGAQSYKSLHTYNNITHPTFKEACNACGLLSNDQEWYNAFDKAPRWATSNQLR